MLKNTPRAPRYTLAQRRQVKPLSFPFSVFASLRETVLTFVLAALFGISTTAAAAESTLLDRYFDGLQTLSAAFEQTLYDAQGSVTQTAQGRLSIQRPGRFRWDYDSPYRQLVLGDGQRIWTFDADLEQATVRPQDDALAGTPALLLSADQPPRSLFVIKPLPMRDDETWYELSPLAQDTQFNQLRLGFNGDSLVAMELIDGFDQLTVFRFSDGKRNGPVAAGLFKFVPPPGVDIIGTPP